ncbi:MAG: glycosyltransferase family 4 protein [Dehalococcoidia bacterium]|nr:glycosyltransferase family 4 protein [Dehalococcoidia bacterium]
MKILISTPIFPPEIGGPATYTMEVAQRLQERGHEIRIVAFTDVKPQVENLEVIPVRIRYPILGTFLRQTKFFFTLLSSVKSMDLIYLQDPVVVGVASLLVGKLVRKPLVLKFVGDSIWEKEYSLRRTDKNLDEFSGSSQKNLKLKLQISLLKFVFNHMSRIIVPSFYLRDILIKHYGVKPDRIAVVHNSVDARAIERPTGSHKQRNNKQIISIGRMVRHKRIDGIITTLKELCKKFPGTSLALVGDGPERKPLERLAENLGVTQSVRFYGSIEHERTLELLSESDVFMLNSIYEGLPHTVIEAMNCSVPVVATNIRGTNEAIDDGRTGLLVSLDNEEGFANQIGRLFEDRQLSKQLVKKALAAVAEKFSWENNLVKLETELEKAI